MLKTRIKSIEYTFDANGTIKIKKTIAEKPMDVDCIIFDLCKSMGYEFDRSEPYIPYQYYETILGLKKFMVRYGKHKYRYVYAKDLEQAKANLPDNIKGQLIGIRRI